MRKRASKRKSLINEKLERGTPPGIELYRKVRHLCQLKESHSSNFYNPEYYIRSFNRTVKSNFNVYRATIGSIPSYFVLTNLYYELIERRTISANFPQSHLTFFILGTMCAVVIEVQENTYCQLEMKRLYPDVRFITKYDDMSDKPLECPKNIQTCGIKAFYITPSNEKVPIKLTKPIGRSNSNNVYISEEDLFISSGKKNFVGFS